ncbi:YqaA family protein [Faunimonas sp. B44]|uniref:YqaA family protein n=1 Tax=Faunimonas sp. B44 TaxID=3461493 RepID=UPI0040444A12
MLRPLYEWTMRLAESRNASTALGTVSFIESSVFPIPPDALLVPMVLANRARAWRYAFVCTVTSVLGGLAGYLIGALLFELVAQPILALYGYADRFQQFADAYNRWGAWAVLFAGVTPFPFKVITIASGATQLSLPIFIVASLVARGIRFYAVAGLLYLYGPPIRRFIEERLGLVFTLSLVLLIGGFVLVKFVA